MCLVVYSNDLPRPIHDSLMKVLESDSGQQADTLADVLDRHLVPDTGQNLLHALHTGRLINKVATDSVTMVLNAKNSIVLNKLNTMLDDIAAGKEASKQMAEVKNKNPEAETTIADVLATPFYAPLNSENVASKTLRAQAARMLAEADVLDLQEAAKFSSAPKTTKLTREEKTATKDTILKKKGRQKTARN